MKLWQLTFAIVALAGVVIFAAGALFRPQTSPLAKQQCRETQNATGRETCAELGLK